MPLKVSDGIASYIDDFKKSDAPQFKGKSDKERRDMAIAAYLSAKKGPQNETKAAPKGFHFTKDGKLKRGDADVDGPGGQKLRADPLDKQRSKVPPVSEAKVKDEKPPFEGPYRKAGEVRKDKYGNVVKNLPRHLARKAARKAAGMNEETNFQVNIEGLPMMFMSGMGQGEIMQKLRKIVKQPSMIQSVKRVTDADVKKTFRLKAQGRDEEEQVDEAKLDELSPATMNSYKRKAADDLYKSHSRYSSILSKPKTKKDREALDKHVAKRKAGLDLVRKRSGTAGYQDESK